MEIVGVSEYTKKKEESGIGRFENEKGW